jgi:hypothetical protein
MPRIREHRHERWTRWFLQRVVTDLPSVIAIDTETTGVAWTDVPFCATLTYRAPDGQLVSGYVDLESDGWEERRDLLREILMWVPAWVFHNAKFDLAKLDQIAALPALDKVTIEDTQPLAALLDENRRLALKVLAVEELGIEDTVEVEVKSGPNKGKTKLVPREQHHLNAVRRKLKLKKEDGYHLLPREVLIPYAIRDTELTLLLYEKLRPRLPADLEEVYAEEIELTSVLRRMEANGVGVDVGYLSTTLEEYGAKVMELWMTLVDITRKPDFNPNSVPQLKAAFKLFGVTLDSTDKAAMRDLLANTKIDPSARELAETLHEYREAEKVYTTYLRSLADEQRDGVWHPWFNSIGPRTGRMSSSTARA